MYLKKVLPDGCEAAVIARLPTKERLLSKCFRGDTQKKAGNFTLWNSLEELFRDEIVLKQFLDYLSDIWNERDFGTHSLCVAHTQWVGWESTAPLGRYASEVLERFDLNRRSEGLRVKLDRVDLFAPRTNELTIIFEFKSENDRPVAIIHSIYPGRDVGELIGNVTKREQRVFFDWNHPGEE